MHEEGDLVQQAVAGDQRAFAELYEGYFNRIYRYVYLKTGDRVEAEDMTQQVFVNALKSISGYRWQGKPFSAWLFRIAHNQIVDHLRRRTRQPATLLNEPLLTGGVNPLALAEHNLDMEQVARATKRLTKAQQEVVSLRFAAGLSIEEVARSMGRSQGAVKALQHSAIIALRKVLVKQDEEIGTI